MKPTPALPLRRLAAAVLLLPTAWLSGQSAPAAAPAAEPDRVQLSPFEVRTDQDVGYTATSSLAGGKLATDLRDTPVSLSVMTKEFLDDIGANTFTEAAAWAPNTMSVYDYQGGNLFNDYQIASRSLGGGFSARNFFVWYINSDSYNTERLDFARGPNSVVFGDANVGGMANISTKRAYKGSLTELQYRNTDWGGDGRIALDVNRALTANWFLRINTLYERQKGWEDRTTNDRDGWFVTSTYQPFKHTAFRVDYEVGDVRRVLRDGVTDSLSAWDGVTRVTAPLTTGNFGGGITRRTADMLTFVSTAPQLGIVNWRNFGATSGNGRTLDADMPSHAPANFPRLPYYGWSFTPANDVAANKYHAYAGFLEQRIGERLFLEAAYNFQQQYRYIDNMGWNGLTVDVNTVLPDGRPNPYFGQRYTETGNIQHSTQGNKVHDYRLTAAYLFESKLTNQRFFASAGKRLDYFESFTHRIGRVNNPASADMFSAANTVRHRRYESELDAPWAPPVGTFGGIETRWGRQTLGGRQQNIKYLQLASSGSWFKSRSLQTLIGVRRDELERLGWPSVTRNATNEVLYRGPLVKDLHQKITTTTVGAVYHLNPSFALFVNRGESFQPLGAALGIDENALPPLENKGLDVGLRLRLLGGRISGSLSYYDNEQQNARIAGNGGDINAIWDDLGRPETVPGGYNDLYAFKGEGFEVDFTANLTPSWRLLFNLGLPKTEQIDGLYATRAYFNTHVAAWRAGAAATADPTVRTRILTNIADIENRINGFEAGRALNDTVDYTANIFTNYAFKQGRLKGLTVGGGVNFRGKRVTTNYPNRPFDYIYANAYQSVTLTAGYSTKLFNRTARFQLNVSNLFDEDFQRYRGYTSYTVNGVAAFVGNGYLLQAPRRITLTTTVRF